MQYFKTLLLALALVLSAGILPFSPQQAVAQTTQQGPTIEVLDFHGKHRCRTCFALERQSTETLKRYYPQQLERGQVAFRLVDTTLAENEALAEQLGVSGMAVFLRVTHQGKVSYVNISGKAISLAHDEDKFQAMLKKEIDKQLRRHQ